MMLMRPKARKCQCISATTTTVIPVITISSSLLAVIFIIIIQEYISNGSRRWFADDLPSPQVVNQWTYDELDQHLHELSRWNGFSPAQFRSFVEHQIKGLALLKSTDQKFRFLEVGIGVGAFARHILKVFPNATGMGIDLEANAISLAQTVLPLDRIHLLVANMLSIPALDSSFDYLFAPGSLCYLNSHNDVLLALSEFSRVLKPGGGLCVSMLPSLTSDMGSCNIRIPKSIWNSTVEKKNSKSGRGGGGGIFGLQLVAMEEMDSWDLPHSMGRYSICARKEKEKKKM